MLLYAILQQAHAQSLKPGFDKEEYLEMLRICSRNEKPSYYEKLEAPRYFQFAYRSGIVGLDNLWSLWTNKENTAVISVRGTTLNTISWMANFYAAMAPAIGTLQIANNEYFKYQLADNPRAAVHVGWLVCMTFLARDITPRIDSCYRKGFRNFIITGHSQGGAISYLLTSYYHYLQKKGKLPADIRFKTYCSAAPKPGNLYYAYDYEHMTQQGWAFNVVNAADWVPETPVSIQTIKDFNNVNPFVNARAMIKKQKFPNNIILKYGYNRLDKPTKRAQRNYEKYLGRLVAVSIKKHLSGFEPPEYYPSNDYVRTGHIIVLKGDEDYYRQFPDDPTRIFVHHLFEPYIYLAEKNL